MIYVKKLKKNEQIKLDVLRCESNLRKVSMPNLIVGNFVIMPRAKRVSMKKRPPIEQMVPLFRQMYSVRIDIYSEGIYSFARKGRNKKNNELFYQYIDREIESLIKGTTIKQELQYVYELSKKMWDNGIRQYRDTYFYHYELLHGDLHCGNILKYMGKYRLIDWEYLRSGPKELEISFYLIWDYLQDNNRRNADNLYELQREVEVLREHMIIREDEKVRIVNMLIPMWFLICVCFLSNGNLRFSQRRIEACQAIIPKYYEVLYALYH